MRVRTIALLLLGLAMAWPTLAAPAFAHEGDESTTTTTAAATATTATTVNQGPSSERVGIGDGIFLTGAVITSPGDEPPRTFDAYHAAVFVQSWLASAYFGGGGLKAEPPADLPVYRVDSTGEWGSSNARGTVTVYFATDGTTAYVAFPGLVVWTDPAQVPPPSAWFSPPGRVIDAFNGEAELEDTTGTQSATSTTTDPPAEPAATDDTTGETSERPWATIASVAGLVAGLVVLVVLVVLVRRSRRSRASTDPA